MRWMVDDPGAGQCERKLELLRALSHGHTGKSDEEAILDLLRNTTRHELNRVVQEIDVSRLFSKLDDHVLGPANRTALAQLLVHERLGDLTPRSRAAIALALQKGHTCKRDEWNVLELFLSLQGDDLTEFKNAIDLSGGHHDLMQLVYHDVDADAVREQLLAHIATAHARPAKPAVKVLSDIDDTFLANWKDTRFPGKTVYPGVIPFYRELDRGPLDEPDREGDLTFVTARPNDRLGVVETVTLDMLRSCGISGACVLGGAFRRLIGNKSIARGKYENFERYLVLYPEYDFVFVGDSGQGDAVFGRRLMQEHGDVVRAVFIHDVVDTPGEERRQWRRDGVVFFDTYVGAAVEAWRKGLVQAEGVRRIIEQARSSLGLIEFKDEAMRAQRVAAQEQDIAAAEKLLARA